MMHCMNCGTQLPDEASFCWKCGKPQKSIAQSSVQSSSVQWETCEIQWIDTSGFLEELFLGRKGYFEAKAIGPNGVYVAEKTGTISGLNGPYEPSQSNRAHRETHERLVAYLAKEGWEPISVTGVKWWQSRFQRRVR